MKDKFGILVISAFLILVSCSNNENIIKEQKYLTEETKIDTVIKIVEIEKKLNSKVKLGIDVLKNRNFDILQNKKVGLITNQTGVNNELKSTIDILFEAKNVNLSALFGPEHGVRGDIEGGTYVESYIDSKTNLPVYSLYGKTRKPSKEVLNDLDILVYDIQDIGVRSYTFISTLGLAIEAASENNLEFVILDRPNPLGGKKIEGNITENDFISFIGQFPIPYVYGLTCGELAQLLIKEGLINVDESYNIGVIPMENWNRSMIWEDTNLEWIPTSPHIPNDITSYFYPMTGILGELRSALSIGVGYTLPFQIIGTEWIEADKLAEVLNKQNIPGLFFRPISFIPYYAFGKGKTLKGVQVHIINYDDVNLTKTQFYIITAIRKLYPEKDLFKIASNDEINMFNKAIGTDKIFKMINNNDSLENIFEFLDKDVEKFREVAKKYHIYN
ncbi:MAG: DUF1343 domain-containing protein [Ignavibacteriales bacterium]|nr:DUF1343 domain-containing protein [Ignavibacteriales bacterium]